MWWNRPARLFAAFSYTDLERDRENDLTHINLERNCGNELIHTDLERDCRNELIYIDLKRDCGNESIHIDIDLQRDYGGDMTNVELVLGCSDLIDNFHLRLDTSLYSFV